MATDKREAKRFEKSVFVIIPDVSADKRYAVDNISLVGLAIHSPASFKINQTFNIQIILPDLSAVFCKCRVSWVAPATPSTKGFGIGLEFLDLTSEDRGKLLELVNFWPDKN